MNSANRSTKEEIEKWLKPFLQKNLKNYNVLVSGSTEKGDGYLGDISFVEVCGKTENNIETTYNFVIKSGKKSTQLRALMPIRKAFENEICFYNEILSTFAKFQAEKGIKEPFNNVPKCYDTSVFEDIEVLVLENLKTADYHLWDRTQPMNAEHIRKVVKTYGKLHAISFALRDQKPELFKELGNKLTDVLKLIYEAVPQPKENTSYRDIIALAQKKGDSEIVKKATLLQEWTPKVKNLTDPNDPFAVILHGDCWNNNFMFKYEDDQKTKLSEVCLLDFQLSRLASPVYDLSYFLFTCISEDDVKNFDEINKVYYESFSDFLTQLGSDPKKMFPFEEFMDQWRRFSRFGLTMMPSIIKICLSNQDEVADLAENVEAGIKLTDAFTNSVKNSEGYARRTLPVMRLAIDKKFI